MNVTMAVPKSLQAFVTQQAAAEGHSSVDKCILALLREAQRQEKAEQALEELLGAATDSLDRGEGIEVTPEFWEDLRRIASKSPSRRALP